MRPIYRFFLAALLVQAVGGILGLIFEVAVTGLASFALGAGMATPFSFAVGALFQRRRPGEARRSPEETAFGLLLGVIALGLGANAWFGEWPAEKEKLARVQALREIDADAVTALRVYMPESGRDEEFTAPEAIREFFEFCRDAECVGGLPAGLRGRSFVVEFRGARPMLLECRDLSAGGDAVVGRLLAGSWTAKECRVRNLGAFRSESLGKWFARHLP